MRGSLLERMDAFGMPLPSFNLRGKEFIRTRLGGVCTLLILAIVLLYASVKFMHLQTRHNPTMSSYFKDTDPNFSVDLNSLDFRIAFAVEDFLLPKKLKNSPKYVKWLFRLFGRKDGQGFHR